MPPLGEFQRITAHFLLGADIVFGSDQAINAEPPSKAWIIHRRTIFYAWTRVLKQSYPSLSKLLGEEEFARLAVDYATLHPPKSALLCNFGDHLPDYLSESTAYPAARLLADAARFDLALETASSKSLGIFATPLWIDENIMFQLDASVQCERFSYAVDTIRDGWVAQPGKLSAHEEELRAECAFAIWRGQDGAVVRRIGESTAEFLDSLLARISPTEAIERAVTSTRLAVDVISDIQRELFAASYCRVTSRSTGAAA
jgi:hypothetical protein